MDRRNGGDRLAPPRPPKNLPRIHRQRAPDTLMMSSNPFHTSSIDESRPPLQPRNLQLNQQPPPLPPSPIHLHQTQTTTQPQSQQPQSHNLVPITVPLTSLSSSASFSRRRPPITGITLPSLSTISSQNFETQQPTTSPVTLAAPRPETERLANEYVDTPFRAPQTALRHSIIHGTHQNQTHSIIGSQQIANISQINPSFNTTTVSTIEPPTIKSPPTATIIPFTSSSATRISSNRTNVLPTVITKQPLPCTKDVPTNQLNDDIDIHPTNSGEPLNLITCPQCKRCRCEQCQRPRQLPSRWICDDTCLCSAETIIDYTSCLCCVKALFYHCSKDHEIECEGDSISCADDPCSCLPHKRTQRWAWLSALSLALPCLCFYWPMKGCVAVCAKCYARHSRHGCRCPAQNLKQSAGINNSNANSSGTNSGRTFIRTNDLTPEKRLLDSSPEF